MVTNWAVAITTIIGHMVPFIDKLRKNCHFHIMPCSSCKLAFMPTVDTIQSIVVYITLNRTVYITTGAR